MKNILTNIHFFFFPFFYLCTLYVQTFVWILLSTHMHTNSTETCPDTFLFQPLEWSSWERNWCRCFKYSETHISIQLRPNVKARAFKVTGMFRQEAGNSTPSLNHLTPGSSHCTRANTHNKNCLLISSKDTKSTFLQNRSKQSIKTKHKCKDRLA